MGRQSNKELVRHLPLVFAATFAVVVLPLILVLWLRRSGIVQSAWAGSAVGVVASLLLSQAGAAVWKRRSGSNLMFSELMLWGWIQRWRSERRLTVAADLLGVTSGTPDAIEGGQLTPEQKSSLLTQLTSSLEARDPYTHGHSRRVARHAASIAKQMGLPAAEVATIRAAGAMHDVGKVDTPIEVLQKADKLTDDEFAIVQRHPGDGADMVATLNDDELTDIVRHHHERLDGTGYPDGLAGDAIPLGARILAVADTFDAITSTRPYRQANSHKKALDILAAEAGTQLDPDAVNAFLRCYSGRRPLALWTLLANARPQLAARLGDAVSPAAATNVVATAATAAAVGAAAIGPAAVASPEVPRSPDARPAASAPAAPAGSPMIRGSAPASKVMATLEPSGRSGGSRDGATESTRQEGRGVSGTPAPGTMPRSTTVLPRSLSVTAPAEQAPATTPAPTAAPDPTPVKPRRPDRGRRRGQGRPDWAGRGQGPKRDRVRPGPPAQPWKPAKPPKPVRPGPQGKPQGQSRPPAQGRQQAPAEPQRNGHGNGNGNGKGQDRPKGNNGNGKGGR